MRYQPVEDAPYAGVIRARTNATTHDMVRDVTDAARRGAAIQRRIGWPRDIARKDAARAMHSFVNQRLEYIREDGDQLIRMPWRSLEDGHGDCKSTAVMIASMCAAAGCAVALRFVQYEGDAYYAHVYAVVDGVPVDPQLTFGKETLHSFRTDRRIA